MRYIHFDCKYGFSHMNPHGVLHDFHMDSIFFFVFPPNYIPPICQTIYTMTHFKVPRNLCDNTSLTFPTKENDSSHDKPYTNNKSDDF